MGIDFTFCNAHWSYSGFHIFRTRVAEAIGIENLDKMENFEEWDGKSNLWSSVDSPLVHLLNHSDCDGELSVEQCRVIIPALVAVMRSWQEDDRDRIEGERLVEGMQSAVDNNEPLTFC
jgi:hypothetical protein